MPPQNRGDSPNRRGGRRRKRPPTRFSGAGAPPQPPYQEPQHAPPQQQIQETPAPVMDSDESGTDPEEFDEVITVSLSELRSNVQCPICLGIVKRTRTVMGCLHRFCRECIDKSMRLGNNECPACRMHCASRRSLRDDLAFDALVSSVYQDVDKYEQEELVLFEEEKAANEQFQASINECFRRQSEASRPRKGRPSSSSAQAASRFDQMCSRNIAETSGLDDHHQPTPTPCLVADAEDAANTDLPTWGGGGFRSQARRSGANGKGVQASRVEKLAHHLANVGKNDHQHVVTAHLQRDEVVWLKDFGVGGFGKEFKAEAKGCAPHISGSVLNLILKGERLMDAMKNGTNP